MFGNVQYIAAVYQIMFWDCFTSIFLFCFNTSPTSKKICCLALEAELKNYRDPSTTCVFPAIRQNSIFIILILTYNKD